MSDDFADDSVELSDPQKFGVSMRFFGYSRIVTTIGAFIISIIVSSIVTQTTEIPDGLTVEETMNLVTNALMAYLERPWVLIATYVLKFVTICGLAYFVIKTYGVLKFFDEDSNLVKLYYLMLGGLFTSIIYLILNILSRLNPIIFWTAVVLQPVIPALAVAAYFILHKWAAVYEQQLGAQFPILSSRIRRIMIGEILVLTGILFGLFGMFSESFVGMGFFITIGDILVALNLIKSGKLVEIGTFPQMPFFPSEETESPEKPSEPTFTVYQRPQKEISDEVYYCPHCGSALHSETQDFCMKCGKQIPRPND